MTHLYASDPDRPTRRRRGTAPCAHCEATSRGCETNQWLRGRRCCEACAGDHDTEATTDKENHR